MVAAGAAEVATAVVDSAEGVTTQVEAQELVQALVYPWAGAGGMAALGSADDEAATGADVADETTVGAGASLVTTVTTGAADDSAAGLDHE